MRLPDPPAPQTPAEEQIFERVRARRAEPLQKLREQADESNEYAKAALKEGASGVFDLDLALLHAPLVADGWNSFLGAIRTGTTLPASIRELVICRVAALNRAAYEWKHHAPLLREALASEGVMSGTVEQLMHAIRRTNGATFRVVKEALDSRGAMALEYADAMTVNVEVQSGLFDTIKALFTDRETVELTATVAAYNCVSRFLVALQVGEEQWVDED